MAKLGQYLRRPKKNHTEKHHSPLDVPELLEPTLRSLTLHALTFSALTVCCQWISIVTSVLSTLPVTWYGHLKKGGITHQELSQALKHSKSLIIHSGDPGIGSV